MDAGGHSNGGRLMLLTIEIPDQEVRRLLGPIFRTVEMEPSPLAVDKVDGLRVLSIPEAAEALGVGRAHLYNLIKRGELPTVHMGRRTGITNEDLRDYLTSA